MKTILLLLLSVLPAVASAATYEVELGVPAGAPPSTSGVPYQFKTSRHLTTTSSSNVVVQSTFAPISCRVEAGHVWVDFKAWTNAWPQSYPQTATCTLAGDSLVVYPAVLNPALDPTFRDLDVGQANDVVLTKSVGSKWVQSWLLPAGSYIGGTYPSTLQGVDCKVSADANGHHVQVTHRKNDPLGSGSCTIARPVGMPAYSLSLTVQTSPL